MKVHSHNESKELFTYALLKYLSDVSLCGKDLAVHLGIQGEVRRST